MSMTGLRPTKNSGDQRQASGYAYFMGLHVRTQYFASPRGAKPPNSGPPHTPDRGSPRLLRTGCHEKSRWSFRSPAHPHCCEGSRVVSLSGTQKPCGRRGCFGQRCRRRTTPPWDPLLRTCAPSKPGFQGGRRRRGRSRSPKAGSRGVSACARPSCSDRSGRRAGCSQTARSRQAVVGRTWRSSACSASARPLSQNVRAHHAADARPLPVARTRSLPSRGRAFSPGRAQRHRIRRRRLLELGLELVLGAL
mmetsp:Transcript_22087/g.51338  ORF Transcript_22087/g.51338 Transcript_22087/m.51338 type:complete len:250 (-) Transcript_22087:218-967(-)